MARMLDPASLQVVEMMRDFKKEINNASTKFTSSFETVATSLSDLNTMFTNSKLFRKENAKAAINFYKVTPRILEKISRNLKESASAISTPQSVPAVDTNNMFLEDLISQVGSLREVIDYLNSDVEGLEPTTLSMDDDTKSMVSGLKSDLSGLQTEMGDIIKSISLTGNTTQGAAENIDYMNLSLSEMVQEMSELTQGANVNADAYLGITRNVRDINNRLMRVRRNLEKIHDDMESTNDEAGDYSDKMEGWVKSILAVQGLDLFDASGARDAATTIAGLTDELLELKKYSGDANFSMGEWKKSAIDTAKELNKIGAAADPAEIVDLYTAIKKTGVEGDKEIRNLAKSIKLVVRGTNLSKEDTADLGATMIKEWGLGSDSVGKYISSIISMQKVTGRTTEEIVDATKDMGQQFAFALRNLSKEGKETFMIKMAGAVGAFRKSGIKSAGLFEKLAESLTDPAAAATKLRGLLTQVGYSAEDIRVSLEKGDPTRVLQAILKGASTLRGQSALQLKRLLQDAELTDNEITLLTQHAGDIQKTMLEAQTTGLRDYGSEMSALRSNVEDESKKLGNLFSDLGQKIKTGLTEIGVGAIRGFGVDLLSIAKYAAPFILVADKLGFEMKDLGKHAKDAIGKVWDLAKSLIGFGAAETTVTTATAGMTVATEGATAATGFFSTALSILSGPVGWITLAIVGLTAAIIAAYKWGPKLFGMFEKKFPEAGKAIRDFIMPIAEEFRKVKDAVMPVLQSIWGIIKEYFIIGFKAWMGVAKIAFKLLTVGFKLIWAIVKPVAKLIGNAIAFIWEKFTGSEMVKEGLDNFDAFKAGAKVVMRFLRNAGDKVTAFFDNVGSVLDDLGDWFTYLGDNLGSFVDDVSADFGIFLDRIGSGIENIKTFFTDSFTFIKDKLVSFSETVTDLLVYPFKFAFETVTKLISKISDFLRLTSKIKAVARFFGWGEEEPKTETVGNTIPINQTRGMVGVSPNDMLYEASKVGGLINTPASTGGNYSPLDLSSLSTQALAPTYSTSVLDDFIKAQEDKDNVLAYKGDKIITPEPSKKIFAAAPEIMISTSPKVEVHQKEVVKSIEKLIKTIEKGQEENKKEKQNDRNRPRRSADSESDLLRKWTL